MGSAAKRNSRVTQGFALLMIAGACMSAIASTKTPAIEEPKDISSALLMIGADEFSKRESASDFLMHAPADALPEVEKRLENEKDPETIERLSRIALHLFLKEKTSFDGKAGFLGIAYKLETEIRGKFEDEVRPVITVVETLAGFPSAENLKPGDRIIGLEGTEFPSEFREADFRDIISNKKPGTKLTLMVERGKERINVSIPLAGIKDLDQISMGTFKNLRENMAAKYLHELKHGGDKPIEVPFETDYKYSSGGGTSNWDVYMEPKRNPPADLPK